jgi:hypothetical protein
VKLGDGWLISRRPEEVIDRGRFVSVLMFEIGWKANVSSATPSHDEPAGLI